MTTTDRELMHRVATGDERAFTELSSRYGARLLTLAWRLLGNRADAEDAVQRALLRLYTSAKSYRSEWAVSTWLYRITTNVCVDEMRRRRSRSLMERAAQEEADGQAVLFPSGGGHGGGPVRNLDVRRALERVPLEARVLLALRYVDGLSYRELARVRGITVNTVKSQLARGKSIVKGILEEGGPRRRTASALTKGAES
jgi:RNA polymerase sigma-70 factor, ECF subfamily